MAEITLVAESKRGIGTPESKRLRHAGRIPAVVYGHGMGSIPVSVDGRELRHALSGGSGLNQLLSVEVDGTAYLALARELQRHPVRNTVVHVDFQVVGRDEVITADVPVVLVGEAKSVEQNSGVVEHPLQALAVRAKPADIPASIEVDITDLTVGDTIRVADLALPAGVTTEVDPEEAVVLAALSAGGLAEDAAEAAADAEPAAEEG
jgi:large subunit ribosomal protein L25